ncbi:Gldg family protein [Niabella pedocola]|uniref:Gldg family protein n=1 Tax=Niabella pedocola TaxID=1752077 RepID=A0ABS8PX84_9BACT|nr:Gldg family protein [Niabella pedocola]MCD2425682.1 Gldg family protein [Niabella pedocola]
MRLILKIAKNELRNLFYTPVAWFTLIVFWVMCAFFYTHRLQRIGPRMYSTAKEYPYLPHVNPGTLTEGFITGPGSGMLSDVLQYLYLFIPLLTMGIISREFNAGTYRLLHSSPLRLRQLIIGKFLGATFFNLFFMVMLAAFMLTAAFDIKSIDYGLLVSASIGIFLLLSAYTAVSFFASSLTRYPIVAAVVSFTILISLNKIDALWQQYDFVRDLTYFLSLKGRTGRMLKGLITTRDIIYFMIIIVMFVSFALLVIKSSMQQTSRYLKVGRYLAVIILCLTAGYFSSRQNAIGYLDVSAGKTNSLHPKTQQRLQLLDGAPMEVTLYTNLLPPDPNRQYAFIGFPENMNAYLDLWEPYRRYKRDIRFKYVYYYALAPGDSLRYKTFPGKNLEQIAGLTARAMKIDASLFMGPEEIKKIIDPGVLGYERGMKITWKDRSVYIRYFPSKTGESIFNGVEATSEPPFNAAFQRLAGARMPHVGFVTGQLERSITKTGEREYAWLNELYPLGFDLDTLNLKTQNIPADITTLVLADPKQELSAGVEEKLKSYISRGGNMFILGEPGKQNVLNPLLQQLGVKLLPGQLVHPSFHNEPDVISCYETPFIYGLADEYRLSINRRLMKVTNYRIPSGDTSALVMNGVAGLSYNKDSGFNMAPLIMTIPEKSWQEMGKLVQDSVVPQFEPQRGDLKAHSYPVAIKLTRPFKGKEQRIVVTGDADFASPLRLEGNAYYVRGIFSWLDYNRNPAYTLFPFPRDNWLLMTPSWVKLERLTYVWVIPSLLLLLGIVLLVRRKRR